MAEPNTGIQRKPCSELKRSAMPQRTTGLKPGGPLRHGDNPLRRKKRLEPGGKALARFTSLDDAPKKPRKRQKDTGPSKTVKDLLKVKRDKKGMCDRCGLRRYRDVHHRRGRKMGGTKRPEINDPCNLILLCSPCHHAITVTNGYRADYEFEGLLIREDGRDPADVPVLLADGWFLLNNKGTQRPTSAPEVAA